MKRIESRLFAGAIVGLFVLGLFMQSCSSNTSTPVGTTDVAAPMVNASTSGLTVPEFTVNTTGFDTPYALNPIGPNDSTGKGGPGNGGPGGPNMGGVRMRPLPIPCLGLDSNQMLQLKQIMSDAAVASKTAADAYRAAMGPVRSDDSIAIAAYRDATKGTQQALQDLQKSYRQKAADILSQVKAGTMTRADAQTALQALRTQFASDSKSLLDQMSSARKVLNDALNANNAQRKAASDAYQAALKQIQDNMNAKIAGILTPAQLALWQIWLNGGDPCKGKGGPPHK